MQPHNNFLSTRDLWQRWYHAASTPEVTASLLDLYNQLADRIKQQNAACLASGKCCKFETYGHRLYVTGFEIAFVLHQLIHHPMSPESADDNCEQPAKSNNHSLNVLNGAAQSLASDNTPIDGCVYQIDGLCSIHPIRPLGCRIYFCDQQLQDWQNDLYEEFLKKLQEVHMQYEIPYRYVEWRTSLAEASEYIQSESA
ncbi:hypothetical protein KS4_10150 [Poriferisphaera corsica]|uniref:YkgJ family cysteine cluster protein n=2 Tax=Poriferisphaera corsica TaxID=2528020 RepID=A0A517YRY4_9BACT|nr:hypothetical protein KS4_10150 [Poriferisphaera corsica]